MKDQTSGKMTNSGASDMEAARRVFKLAAQGINDLTKSLDRGFIDALDLMSKVTGRVIVSGIGKSGHIANKIAATLASTGTPAFFVHPAEASHGDLGMITRNDLVLAISNSGETLELSDLVSHAQRFDIPLIAITSDKNSFLGENADAVVILPEADEACPMGLAPTTSTTMTLALGDAMAIALLERKGFSSEDFQVLHPGGHLGHRLLNVADAMHQGDEIPLIDRKASMADAILTMTAKRFGCVGATGDKGELIGIITDGDLRRHMGDKLLDQTVEQVMHKSLLTIRSQALLAEALGIMNAKSVTALFVVDDGDTVGILHIHDCLRAGLD